ncbi:MAG: homocysteine S-methyltransferase family protein, partial [Candidatus Hermodarchaeota archaeon]
LNHEEVDVIGANCTIGSNDMLELLKLVKNYTSKPFSVKPNAGQPIVENGKTYYNQPVEEFARDINEMIKLGAKIVGGCCGTSPKTIMSIRKIIDSI